MATMKPIAAPQPGGFQMSQLSLARASMFKASGGLTLCLILAGISSFRAQVTNGTFAGTLGRHA